LSLTAKLRLYTSLVQSVLLYESEAWTLRQDDEKCLQAFHMKRQRYILQVNWYDFITSDSVREQMKLVDLPLVIADRRHATLDHIIRLPEETPAPTILQHVISVTNGSHLAAGWKRPTGRPWKTSSQIVTLT